MKAALIFIATNAKKVVEECAALVMYILTTKHLSSLVFGKLASVSLSIATAYAVHLLKKNYWDTGRPFFRNIIGDLINWIRKK